MDASWFKDPEPDQVGYSGKCNAMKRAGAPTGPDGHHGTGNIRCQLQAGFRTNHLGLGPCCFHGGATPQAQRKYERVQAGMLVHGYGQLREGLIDPRDLLMEELARTAGNIDFLTLCLGDLTEEELLGSVPLPEELASGSSSKDGDHWELRERFGVPALVSLYQWERTHLAKLSSDAVKLGLLERAVRVEEGQAVLMATALSRSLQRAGLQPAQLEAARGFLREELLSLEVDSARKQDVRTLGRPKG